MLATRTRFALTLVPLIAALAAAAQAQEVLVLRSGQSGGEPGQYGEPDDAITCISSGKCCAPFQGAPFDDGSFAAARAGNPALVVKPHSLWLNSLKSAPDARWIHAHHNSSSDQGNPATSVLYAIPFEVLAEDPVATLTLVWTVDDRSGDFDGEPNESGAYVNGTPMGDAIRSRDNSYGYFQLEHRVTVEDVPLVQGTNYLYLYQRDDGGVVSGIIFEATIAVGDCVASKVQYCSSLPNSTGAPAALDATGTLGITDNDTWLHASSCPIGTFGLFIYGSTAADYPFGDGILCINPYPGIFRVAAPHSSGTDGRASVHLDFTALPIDGPILPGDTKYFQCIFRDPEGPGGSGYNLSGGLALTFCP